MKSIKIDFRREFADLMRGLRIPSGDSMKSKLEKYSQINGCITPNLPKSLFRYRPPTDDETVYNLEALRNGAIPVSKPIDSL